MVNYFLFDLRFYGFRLSLINLEDKAVPFAIPIFKGNVTITWKSTQLSNNALNFTNLIDIGRTTSIEHKGFTKFLWLILGSGHVLSKWDGVTEGVIFNNRLLFPLRIDISCFLLWIVWMYESGFNFGLSEPIYT